MLYLFFLSFLFTSCESEDINLKNSFLDNYLDNYSDNYFAYDDVCLIKLEQLFKNAGVWKDEVKVLEVFEYIPRSMMKENINNVFFLFLKQEGDEFFVESFCYDERKNEITPVNLNENGSITLDSLYFIRLPITSNQKLECGNLHFKIQDNFKTVGVWRKVDPVTGEKIGKSSADN